VRHTIDGEQRLAETRGCQQELSQNTPIENMVAHEQREPLIADMGRCDER
jgi:hypothetical protein